jgi:hypothetical protein
MLDDLRKALDRVERQPQRLPSETRDGTNASSGEANTGSRQENASKKYARAKPN